MRERIGGKATCGTPDSLDPDFVPTTSSRQKPLPSEVSHENTVGADFQSCAAAAAVFSPARIKASRQVETLRADVVVVVIVDEVVADGVIVVRWISRTCRCCFNGQVAMPGTDMANNLSSFL